MISLLYYKEFVVACTGDRKTRARTIARTWSRQHVDTDGMGNRHSEHARENENESVKSTLGIYVRLRDCAPSARVSGSRKSTKG